MTASKNTIGQRIKNARIHRNLSQAELAKRCDMAQAEISRAENGKGRLLVATVERIANGLGVKTVYFFRT